MCRGSATPHPRAISALRSTIVRAATQGSPLLAALGLAAGLVWLLLAAPAGAQQIVEDTEPPRIVGAPTINSPAEGNAYRAGERVVVRLTFNEAVEVSGRPRLRLVVGDQQRWASYRNISEDGTSLSFSYEVKTSDRDEDGLAIKRNSLRLNGGAIVDAGGNPAKLKHQRLSGLPNHRVNSGGVTGRAGTSSTPSAPDAPTNVKAKPIGDMEVKVSWDAQTTVCPSPGTKVQRYSLRLYELSDGSEDSVVVGLSVYATQYTVTQLKPGTQYRAEVYALGCNLWSAPSYHEFRTAADGQDNDPVKPESEPKMPPNPPTGLTVTKSGDSAEVSWTTAKGDNARCPRAYYVMYFGRQDREGEPLVRWDISGSSTTVTSLPDGSALVVGDQYVVYVVSHSTECGSDSPAVRTIYTHEVYTEPPKPPKHKIVEVTMFSSPAEGDAYRFEERVVVSLTFNQRVWVYGQPRLRLVIGDQERWARKSNISPGGKSVDFSYTVKSGDCDEDGLVVKRNSLRLHGGKILDGPEDDKGEAVQLKHQGLSGLLTHKVHCEQDD